jgi:lipopolysaccharide biosynthesis glycosyltransferase
MNDCAVCYVTDSNYLLPTLISAAGVRKFVDDTKASIIVFLVDGTTPAEEINKSIAPLSITVLAMESRCYSTRVDQTKLPKQHFPITTLGRLFIAEALPRACKRIVYIDGDTWVRRNPMPLIDAVVPDGKFAAVEDMISLRSRANQRYADDMRPYLDGLGISRDAGYFNSGVIAVSRATWATLSADAYEFFIGNPAACHFYDQSALNAVAGGRRLRLSLKWNFQTPFRRAGIERFVDASIYHFTKSAKPWADICSPWEEMYALYCDATASFGRLGLLMPKIRSEIIASNNEYSKYKSFFAKNPLGSRFISMMLGISKYERTAWL